MATSVYVEAPVAMRGRTGAKGTRKTPARRARRTATGPEAELARHRAQCSICRHAQREEIEQEFLDWVPAREIAAEYKLGSHRAV